MQLEQNWSKTSQQWKRNEMRTEHSSFKPLTIWSELQFEQNWSKTTQQWVNQLNGIMRYNKSGHHHQQHLWCGQELFSGLPQEDTAKPVAGNCFQTHRFSGPGTSTKGEAQNGIGKSWVAQEL